MITGSENIGVVVLDEQDWEDEEPVSDDDADFDDRDEDDDGDDDDFDFDDDDDCCDPEEDERWSG